MIESGYPLVVGLLFWKPINSGHTKCSQSQKRGKSQRLLHHHQQIYENPIISGRPHGPTKVCLLLKGTSINRVFVAGTNGSRIGTVKTTHSSLGLARILGRRIIGPNFFSDNVCFQSKFFSYSVAFASVSFFLFRFRFDMCCVLWTNHNWNVVIVCITCVATSSHQLFCSCSFADDFSQRLYYLKWNTRKWLTEWQKFNCL